VTAEPPKLKYRERRTTPAREETEAEMMLDFQI
jgi:hypothetical protein